MENVSETRAKQYFGANLPRKFWRMTFDDWKGDRRARDTAVAYVEALEEHLAAGEGMNLRGEPGTGKTLLATLIAKAYIKAGREAVFIPAQILLNQSMRKMELMDVINGTGRILSVLDVDADEKMTEHWNEWHHIDDLLEGIVTDEVDLLILDDLGNEHRTASGWAENILERVVRTRYYAGLPTITTSNLTQDEIGKAYRPSFASFLLEIGQGVMVLGKDARSDMHAVT